MKHRYPDRENMTDNPQRACSIDGPRREGFARLAPCSRSWPKDFSFLFAGIVGLAVLSAVSVGCASRNVNPAAPSAHTGYVDLYAEPDADLCWHVERFDAGKGRFLVDYSDVKYLEGPVLRLAFKPGSQRLRISFLNCVMQPAECEVAVLDGRITPVRVTFVETGTGHVLTREESRGGTVYGRFGRRTKFKSAESRFVAVNLAPQDSQPYRPRDECVYTESSK
jgi:hypothetical protein